MSRGNAPLPLRVRSNCHDYTTRAGKWSLRGATARSKRENDIDVTTVVFLKSAKGFMVVPLHTVLTNQRGESSMNGKRTQDARKVTCVNGH